MPASTHVADLSRLAWDDFRLVKAIADAKGLTGAAETLALNHSTVFRRLGQIEDALKAKLFERHRSGYAATAAGEEMIALAERMEDDVAAFGRKIAGRAVTPSGELRVTTNDTLLVHLLTPIFAAFRRHCPAISLDVVLTNQSLNLSKRDADIAIRATDHPPETLVGRRLATIAWALYGRRDAFPDGPRTPSAALDAADWVALGDNLATVKAAQAVRARVPPERIAYKVNTVLGLTEAVEAGMGIGPLPCFIADARPALGRLSERNPDFSTGLWLLTHPDLKHSARVRAFLDFVGDAVTKRRKWIEGDG
jgi:DNA-binding transcriptional LysR family regulator